MDRRLLAAILAVSLFFGVVSPSIASAGAPITFDADYARDRVVTVDPLYPTYYPIDHALRLGPHLRNGSADVMGSMSTPVVYQGRGGDEIIYQFGWLDEGAKGYAGLIYGIDATKLEQMVQAGQTNYFPAAYLWGGTPIQLPPLPKDEAVAVGGVSISPDGQWLAVGWGSDIYIWPRLATPNAYGLVPWQTVDIPYTVGFGNPANVSSSPAFFRDAGHLWVAVGSWSGGLKVGVCVGNRWEPGRSYLTTETDPNAKWGAITSSPSWDPQNSTLYIGVNNTDSQWHRSGADGILGWAVAFNPLNGNYFSIGYTDKINGQLLNPGSGTLTGVPVDSSVVVSPSGQSIFVPERDGSVMWYPAETPTAGGPTAGDRPIDTIWPPDFNFSVNDPTTWDISNLGLARGVGDLLLLRVPEGRHAVDESLVDGATGTFRDFSDIGAFFDNWIDPSPLVQTTGKLAVLANTFGSGAVVLQAPLGAKGQISDEQNAIYEVPAGATVPDFAATVALPRGGMALWTDQGLMVWVPGPYRIAVQAAPNPTYPIQTETVAVTVPANDPAQYVTLSWPGVGAAKIAVAGQPASEYFGAHVSVYFDGAWKTYVTQAPSPGQPGSYPITATAALPAENNPSAHTTLVVLPEPPPPPPPPESPSGSANQGNTSYPPAGPQGTIVFNPGSAPDLGPDALTVNPAKWGDIVAATLHGVAPEVPHLNTWQITSATLWYPKQGPGYDFGAPVDPQGQEAVQMSVAGHVAHATFLENWSENGADVLNYATGEPVPPGQGYQVTAQYTIFYTYWVQTASGGWTLVAATMSADASGTIYVNGTSVTPQGTAGGAEIP